MLFSFLLPQLIKPQVRGFLEFGVMLTIKSLLSSQVSTVGTCSCRVISLLCLHSRHFTVYALCVNSGHCVIRRMSPSVSKYVGAKFHLCWNVLLTHNLLAFTSPSHSQNKETPRKLEGQQRPHFYASVRRRTKCWLILERPFT